MIYYQFNALAGISIAYIATYLIASYLLWATDFNKKTDLDTQIKRRRWIADNVPMNTYANDAELIALLDRVAAQDHAALTGATGNADLAGECRDRRR